MYVKEILRDKGHQVFRISVNATLSDVVQELVWRNCGSLVVEEQGALVGIVTERDVLKACAAKPVPLHKTSLRDVMNHQLVTVAPDEKVNHVMGLMTRHRVRHIPVVQDGELRGIVSIGDVVKAQHAELSAENRFLKEYICG